MEEENLNINIKPRMIKCKLIGTEKSGKKTLVFRYTQNKSKFEEQPNFTIPFMFKIEKRGEKKYQLKVFRPISLEENNSKEYLKGIKIVFYIFDLTDSNSINQFKSNINTIFENADKNSIKFIIGNKLDLEDKRILSAAEITALCSQYNYIYREVSANTGLNVNEVFNEALDLFLKKFPDKKETKETK